MNGSDYLLTVNQSVNTCVNHRDSANSANCRLRNNRNQQPSFSDYSWDIGNKNDELMLDSMMDEISVNAHRHYSTYNLLLPELQGNPDPTPYVTNYEEYIAPSLIRVRWDVLP
jgi:hypothetical protein